MNPITEASIERAQRAELMRHLGREDAADRAAQIAAATYAAHYDALREALIEAPTRHVPTPAWFSPSPSPIGRKTASGLDVAYEHICASESPEWAALLKIATDAAQGINVAEDAQQWLARLCDEHARNQMGEAA